MKKRKSENEIRRIAKKWSQNLLTKRSKREILPLRKGSERKYKKCSNPADQQASQEGKPEGTLTTQEWKAEQ
jgi:hypothetical protein